jgi:hypothetical protein
LKLIRYVNAVSSGICLKAFFPVGIFAATLSVAVSIKDTKFRCSW